MTEIKANLSNIEIENLRKIALAVHLGISCNDIEEESYDDCSFSVNPRQIKRGNPPAYFVKYANDLKKGLAEFYANTENLTWQQLVKGAGTGKRAYNHLYKKAEKKWDALPAPSGSIHYWANGLYHLLCGEIHSEEWHIFALRAAFNGEIPEDRRKDDYTDDGEYLVLEDEEATERAREYAKQVFEECYLNEVPQNSFLAGYINLDQAAEDAVNIDGRGHMLSGYDGSEECVTFSHPDMEVKELYIYRTN